MKFKAILLILFISIVITFAQSTINIYFDSYANINLDYIKTKITYINYVNDPNDADVHILITSRSTGSGGIEYTLKLIGKKEFIDNNYELIYFTKSTDSDLTIQDGLVEVIEKGIFPYLLNSDVISKLTINYKEDSSSEENEIDDPWNYWVFSLSLSGSLSGEEHAEYSSVWTSFSASRTTEENKFRFALAYNHNKSTYDFDDDYTYISTSQSRDCNTYYVYSLSDHWSIGSYAGIFTSTYSNIKVEEYLVPAIEYNIFPYSESTTREFILKYRVFYKHSEYYEETIYNKMEDDFTGHGLEIYYALKQTWGDAYVSLTTKQYFQDSDFNNVSIAPSIYIQLFKGFYLNFYGSFTMVHDQLSLPRYGATQEEVLLQRKELETQYNYYISLGITYQFGSIYSNVVNTRF